MNRAVKVVGVGSVLVAVFLSGVAVERARAGRTERFLKRSIDERFERWKGRPGYHLQPAIPQDMPIDLRPRRFIIEPLVKDGFPRLKRLPPSEIK
jgi:hypothetical protein